MPLPQQADGEDARALALETSTASPHRRSLAVASPQRQSLVPGPVPMTPAVVEAPELTQQVGAVASAEPVGNDAAIRENLKLKREKEALEEALKRVQRQSDVDRRNYTEMEAKMIELESKLQFEQEQKELLQQSLQHEKDEQKRTALQVEKLEDELRRKDSEMAKVQRSSVVCTAETTGPTSCIAASASPEVADQVECTDIEGSEPRRRLFTSMANEPSASATAYPPLLPHAAAGFSRPFAEGQGHRGESSAMVRASSSSSMRPVEEEPPQGCVASLRKSFESRGTTHPRNSSQPARQERPQANHKDRGPQTASTAPAMLITSASTTTSARARAGNPSVISTARVPATKVDVEDIDFGMSPIKIPPGGTWGSSSSSGSGASQRRTAAAGDASNFQGSVLQRICEFQTKRGQA
eukprot:TRINITY_DN38248_c0_g1_i2.p1 TRINITY_DN38248_c0_g1~~TRINITY_DN38248_c0_g1_i2.p1  ORF type:complete len:412 (+),score=95.36 TRINITY_DN38248_c0_g1_i2:194-1429(+)